MSTLLVFIGFFLSHRAWSYPEFIGYNYTSCLTCHYNGQGNGPINDYGRAVWASEIAGKIFNSEKSDEDLGDAAGFLGKSKLPWWFRPGLKTRAFYLMPDPPVGTDRFILMQADVNAAFFFDKDQKYAVVASVGTLPEPPSSNPDAKKWISREHYFRWQLSDTFWSYLGKMDKVYGIRTVNHTAYSRSRTGLAQNDQSHGLILHYIREHFEGSFDYFLGDLMDDSPRARQKGLSTMIEYDIVEAWRVGLSFLTSKSEFLTNQRIGIHSKQGLGEGSSLMFELGMITDTPEGGDTKNGYYFFSQATQRIARGYHFFVSGQGYKDKLVNDHPNNLKASFGMLMFPLQRYEFRIEAENSRQLSNDARVPEDSWALLSQLHLSF